MLAFSKTAQAEMMHLTDGDALSVQGALKAEIYEKDGVTELSLSAVADHSPCAASAPSKIAGAGKPAPVRQAARQDAFDDAVPF